VLHGFIWGEFCDWYLELVKTRLYDRENAEIRKAAQAAACHVLDRILRLLHPFMPFISEEIWQALQIGDKTKSILESRYPAPDPAEVDEKAEQEMDLVQKVIGAVRNIRGELNVPQEKKARLLVRGDGRKMDLIRKYFSHVQKLAGLETVDFGDAEKPRESATALAEGLELVVPLEGLIDLKLEQERIRKEMERISGLLAGLEKKLSNEDFIRRAPKEVVEKERQKQADFAGKLRKLGESLELLEGSK
jgi:valyl-tRNA synthetase